MLAIVGVGALVIGALGLIGWGFLSDYIEDQQRPGSTAIKVNDREYTVEDFTTRAQNYSEEIGSTVYSFILPTIAQELIEEGHPARLRGGGRG
jgi:hypothetical protein